MTTHALHYGLDSIRRRPGLAVLIYAANLLLMLTLSIPLFTVLNSAVAGSGFSEELAAGFDLALWADILEAHPEIMTTLGWQLLWMVPLYLIWNTLVLTGLGHALARRGYGSFWQGIARHGVRATLLGLMYGAIAVIAVIGIGVLVALAAAIGPSEAGAYYAVTVLLPLLLLLALALLDMMQDFARLDLIFGGKSVVRAWLGGFAWPFRSGAANGVYILWMLGSGLILLLAAALDLSMGGLFLVFLLQQIMMFGRSATTVGWIGSEVAVWESERMADAELIAQET